MERQDLLRLLTAQRDKFGAFNVKSLAVFGSVARGEARADSDVDLLVEFEGPATFDQYTKLKRFLENLIGGPVDLLTRKGVRAEFVPTIEREAVYVS